MYLSAFTLDIHSHAVQQCFANSHDMHRTIMSGFGQFNGENPRQTAAVLYRLDTTGREIKLYVTSSDEPVWGDIERQGFHKVGTKNITEAQKGIVKGGEYVFDLLASPSKKEGREGKNSRRVPLNTLKERTDWLHSKAEQNGFAIQWVREDGNIRVSVKKEKGAENTYHRGVRFRGRLTVLNEGLVQSAFEKGIGPGKPYGFGLLMLFPSGGA